MTDILCIVLACQGFRTYPAYSAEQAMQAVDEFQPDLAILEAWFWEGMNGLDLADWFQNNHPECKLVLYTAWQSIVPGLLKEERYAKFGLKIWAKPIHPNDMLRIIADTLIPGPAYRA